MCTVTVVPLGDGLRLACNRDESIVRPAGRPPRVVRFGDRRAVLPLDPRGGGTWIAASDAGLVMALLNVTPPGAAPGAGTSSRGRIIPPLLRCRSLDEAVDAARRIEVRRFRPFRLLIADRRTCTDLRIVDGRLRARRRPAAARPLLLTSSGLGDRLVDGPRRALFRRLVVGAPRAQLGARQLEFHRHRWPDRPHLSVDMRRPGARTVSHASIDLLEDRIRFVYRPGGPRGRPLRLTLR